MKNLPLKFVLAAFLLLGILGCSGGTEARKVYDQYIEAYQEGNYAAMWKYISQEDKDKISNQLALYQSGKGVKVKTQGLVSHSEEEKKKLTGKEYFAHIIKAYKENLSEEKKTQKIFDFSTANVESVEVTGKIAIVKLVDSYGNRRMGKMVREKDQWKVSQESISLDKKTETEGTS